MKQEVKAKDLMIGNWVSFRRDFPDRIDGIAVGGLSVHLEHDGWVPIEAVQPIELTEDILKKNGFKDTCIVNFGVRKLRWVSEDERTEITIRLDDTMPMDIVKNVNYEDEVLYELPFPWSVSQLQHTLRLCGIDKEIAL